MKRVILTSAIAAGILLSSCSSFKKNPAETATARATYDLFPYVAPVKEPKRKKIKMKRHKQKSARARASARYRNRIGG